MVRRGSTVRVRQRAYLELGSRCKRRLFCCRDGHCGTPPWQGGDRRYGESGKLGELLEITTFGRASGHTAKTGDRFWGLITGAPSRTGSRARAMWPLIEGEVGPSYALPLKREDSRAAWRYLPWQLAIRSEPSDSLSLGCSFWSAMCWDSSAIRMVFSFRAVSRTCCAGPRPAWT
jgi:hypothetical protein